MSSHGEIVQIVDESQHFTQALPDYIKSWGLYDAGFNYSLCAVFGSQSTGKSTLLNRVFGTTFQVMDETQRQQTTKGIWMSKGVDMPVLVMDVEGTDGRERGEDQDFERKSALFSLASAEVILINLWEHQIGLYQGANMGLLKTVLEVNLSLFQASKQKDKAQEKTLLFFIIRDFIGATPLENLTKTLTVDLERVWDQLSKPKGTEHSKISDYFDMTFDALPHKLLQPEKFSEEVVRLRGRFANKEADDYVFKPTYHKRIPADGVAPYLGNIWEQVLTNKDLDLPTQQELLAQFRCDEISSVVSAAFEDAVLPLRAPISAGSVVEDLGAQMQSARHKALQDFDVQASRYMSTVYQRKRAGLLLKLNISLGLLFVGQLKNLHKSVVGQFKQDLGSKLKGDGYDFGVIVKEARSAAESRYEQAAKNILLEETNWTYTDSFTQLQEELSSIADGARAEETKKMIAAVERQLKKQVAEPVELALNKPSPTMWDSVLSAYKDALDKATATYMRKANSFNCTEAENQSALTVLKRKAWISLRSKIDEQSTDATMLVRLRLAFEDKFRYDETGVPRVWKPTDDIDALFKAAKDETLALIPLYSRISPTDPALIPEIPEPDSHDLVEEDPPLLTVFSDTKSNELANRFRREADAYYIEAKRSLVSSISQVPLWLYGVMALLGWNEFVAVLRSPIYFTMVALLGAVAYVIFSLGMAPTVLRVSQAAYEQGVKSVNEKLREHFSQPVPERPHSNRSPSSTQAEEIELKKVN